MKLKIKIINIAVLTILKKRLAPCLLCITGLFAASSVVYADRVSLGSASPLTVLSASGAVNCVGSTIEGDVGSAVAGTQASCEQNGDVFTPISADIQSDFSTAYSALANEQCGNYLTTLAGQNLAPGTYCVDKASTNTGGVLTLDGDVDDTWLFKIGSSGAGALTSTDFVVEMSGDADACNVTWWVADAVTLTRGDFKGDILAGQAVTVTGVASNSPLKGRIMAKGIVVLTNADALGCVAEAAARTDEAIAAALAAKQAAEVAAAAELLEVVNDALAVVIGSEGREGLIGETGAAGGIGVTGAVGDTGPAGNRGKRGKQGETGAAGGIGATGAAGDTGPAGNRGKRGKQGETGETGASCTTINGLDSATIKCISKDGDVTMASVYDGTTTPGNVQGDMQYFDGFNWALVPAPTDTTTTHILSIINGQPSWQPTSFSIGDTGPAGGFVFYITDGGLHGMEAAPVDQSAGAEWGCSGSAIEGADGTDIGTGADNTNDIIDGCATQGIAARVAKDYTLNGYGGWYLPSKDELNLMWEILADPDSVNSNNLAGFGTGRYFSSSEKNPGAAWGQRFGNGNSKGTGKGTERYVRAVRVF
ncbi:MAG: hypothetical protein ACI9HA_000398 [Dinoroseobacter sp.]|jgi:hypothetical protein